MLYRDSENGVVMGVCAGLAHRLDLSRTGVRLVAFVSLLIFTGATLLAYFVAGFLLRDRPLHLDSRREKHFWRSASRRDRSREYGYSRYPSSRG